MSSKKRLTTRQVIARLAQSEKQRAEERTFYFKQATEIAALTRSRADLAWLVLDAIHTLRGIAYWRDPVLGLIRAGLEHKLDEVMPGFRAQIQAQRDDEADGHARVETAERAQRRAARTPPEGAS